MLLFKQVAALQQYLSAQRAAGKTIGFAPTMGALHAGHVSLIEQANKADDVSVCSIFVNPTQFNDPKDLAKYPRTPEADIALLSLSHCDVLLMPDVAEVYPPDTPIAPLSLDFGGLAQVLEGVFRPGHFDGMAQVVNRLLDIVQPDYLYMGQKDYQQQLIVQSMLTQTHRPTTLVTCEIMREADGLAMSSRNVRLTTADRARAAVIYQTLKKAADMATAQYAPIEIEQMAIKALQTVPNFKVEYFAIADGRTLQPLRLIDDSDFVIALVALWVGEVRLIDNVILKDHRSVMT